MEENTKKVEAVEKTQDNSAEKNQGKKFEKQPRQKRDRRPRNRQKQPRPHLTNTAEISRLLRRKTSSTP